MSFLPTWSDVEQSVKEFPKKAKASCSNFRCADCLRNFASSNRMIVLVVFIGIYLDNMLTTTVVPVIPDFLFQSEHPEDYKRVSGDLDTPGSQELCWEIQKNTSYKLDKLTANGTNLNETISDPQVQRLLFNITHEQNCTKLPISPEEMKKRAMDKFVEQSTRVGLLFASKSFVQLITNPFIGPLTNKVGYSIPMFTGFVIIFASTMVFAFGKSYWVLLLARGVQGVGSACTTVSGMGLIATRYQDDGERGNAMAVALSGLALGVFIGPTFGGVLYEFVGKAAPFLFLAGLALIDGGLQLYVMKPSKTPENERGATLTQLLADPYILLASGAITFSNMGIGMLEPTLPAFMFRTMGAKKWEQGIAFLPASVSYMLGTLIFGRLALKMGRWLATMIGMVIIGLALFTIPFSRSLGDLVFPNVCLGMAIGMVDSAMMPTMAYLVDLRHVSIYGTVYAIADVAFCIGFAVGPAVGGVIVETIGFKWMLWIIGIINLMYAPLLYFLRKPPGNEEKVQLVLNDKCPIKYSIYRQSSREGDRESWIGEAEPILDTEERGGTGLVVDTHVVRTVRQQQSVSSSQSEEGEEREEEDEEEEGTDSESGQTEGADDDDDDDSEGGASSDSEYAPATKRISL